MYNTGSTVVVSAGTTVPLGTDIVNCPVAIKALHTNTGLVAVCAPGVDLSEGYHLNKDEEIILNFVGTLASVWLDSAVNGEGVAWALLNW
jgi:hypothetical protein